MRGLYSRNKKGNIGIPVAAVEGIGAGGSEGEVEDELADEMTASSRCTAVWLRVVRSSSNNVIIPVPAEPEAEVGGVTMVVVDPEEDIMQGDRDRKDRHKRSHQRVN